MDNIEKAKNALEGWGSCGEGGLSHSEMYHEEVMMLTQIAISEQLKRIADALEFFARDKAGIS